MMNEKEITKKVKQNQQQNSEMMYMNRIPHALWPRPQNVKRKQCCNKFNKIF